MKILTLGNGFIANHLPYPKYTKKLPCDDQLSFECRIIDEYSPDVIINCIGKTGKDQTIDALEDDKVDTVLTNTTLPTIMAAECARRGIHFIHISSGCIFQGKSPNIENEIDLGWKETDAAQPPSFYSESKYSTDLAIGKLDNVCSIRIRIPFSGKSSPRNLINKLKGYKKILNEQNSMTYLGEFPQLIEHIVNKKLVGIYHCTNPGTISPVDVMTEFNKYEKHEFEEISTQDLDKITRAKRSNCILNCDKLKATGFEMMPVKEALKQCMKEYFNV